MFRRFLLILIAATAVSLPVDTAAARPKRNSQTVRREQRQNAKKIERTRSQIKSNSDEIRRQLADLDRIGADIAVADSRITVLQHRADSLTRHSRQLADSVNATQTRVNALKSSYASSLRSIRSQRQLSSATAFIFSSRSFSEARRRMRYLSELGEWQKEKSSQLKTSLAELEDRKTRLDSTRSRLATAMTELRHDRSRLEGMQTRSDALVGRLRKQGKRLESTLADQQKQARRLDEELNRIIEEEARKAAEAERQRIAREKKAKEEAERRKREEEARRKKQPVKPKTPTTSKPTEPMKPAKPAAPKPAPTTAATFAQAKGRLPMPVSGSAVIVSDFGRHSYKGLSKVEVQNNGIDIETTPGSHATAVYPGVVSMVIVMDGYHNVVLVRHGEYLTVYAGLADLAVRKGQEVKTGQALGKIWSNPDDGNRTRLHFEVRHEKDKLDPAQWLR